MAYPVPQMIQNSLHHLQNTQNISLSQSTAFSLCIKLNMILTMKPGLTGRKIGGVRAYFQFFFKQKFGMPGVLLYQRISCQ